jgi:2-keto-3-deoxy-L-rhamnonate aldolase RhmA
VEQVSVNVFKKRVRSREALIGTWIKTPSPMVCEVLGNTGLDMVCLDAEHAPFDRLRIDQCVHALRATSMPALVRIPSAAPEHILNALDCGATGVVVPHVTSAAMAESVVKAAHYGPGGRGYAGSSRAAAYTTKPMAQHLADSAAQTTVIAQIEDLEALEAIDEITQVDGVDCLFIGRVDLTVALRAESPGAAEVIDAVERICDAGRQVGRAVGMFVGNAREVPRWRESGASFFLLSSDHGFLQQGAAKLVEEFRADQ